MSSTHPARSPSQPARRPRPRWLATCCLTAVILCAGGCAPAGVIFPPLAQPPRWPGPPEQERIRYVGQIASDADLKPAKSAFQSIGEAIAGKPEAHAMLSPMAACTDGADRLFVVDSNAQLVHVLNLKSRTYAAWKPFGEQGFSQPVGIACDVAGNRLLVSDSVAGVVFAFDLSDGHSLGQVGAGSLRRPCGIAVDRRTGRIFVADAAAHQVIVLSAQGQEISRLGERGSGPGEFNYPTFLAVDSRGWLYVSDSLNFRIQQFDVDLKFVRQIGSQGDIPGYFAQPKGVALDSQDHLYVVDAQFEAVQIFDSEGQLLLDFGEEGRQPGQFWLPVGIFIDPRDRIWVADSYNRRVQVFDFVREGKP